MIVSWNGRLVEEGVVSLPVTDPLFLRGEGVFETIRVDGGAICLRERHFKRLQDSAALLGWAVPSGDELAGEIVRVLKANALENARLRVTLGRECLITAMKLTEEAGDVVAETSVCPVNERSPLALVKGTSYAENMWLLRQSKADEVIRPNTRGELCEGCVSNVFFVRDGRVFTPSLESGCLPGVMRAEILERIEVEEGIWPIAVLQEADEVWLSNAIRRVRRVAVLNGKEKGEASVIYRKLRDGLKDCGRKE